MENKNIIDKMVDFCTSNNLLKPLNKLYYSKREIWLYLLFGVLTTVVNIVSYYLLTTVFNIDYMISNVIAWILSILFAYITNSKFVFQDETVSIKDKISQFTKFVVARLFSLGIDMAVMFVGVSILLINDVIIKIVANIIVIVLNYFISKLIVFKKN